MPRRHLRIIAPSRLHFGLLSFGQPDVPAYGGVGLMIDRPQVDLSFHPADEFQVSGPLAQRVRQFASRWCEETGMEHLPGCCIRVRQVPAQHTGLGVGTQLGLSVAAGLNAISGRSSADLQQLASSVGRGRRSSIGTYGFAQGGLLFERGKRPGEPLASLERRVALPDSWRVVLITPGGQRGLSGKAESQAFDQLPPVPHQHTAQLLAEVQQQLLPAAEQQDWRAFGESVYRYGVLAGSCFATRQGGAFASRQLAHWVEAIRAYGIPGVGQSSWGPSLFAIAQDARQADELVSWLRRDLLHGHEVEVVVARIDNHGARLSE